MSFKIADVPALPAGVASPYELDGTWIIARCRAQYERKLALLLSIIAPGIGYALPMERVHRRVKGQNRGTYTKLVCPSYLFVCCRHEDDYYELVARDGVFDKTAVKDKDRAEFVHQLNGIHVAANSGLLLTARRPEIKPGVRCRVIAGDLAGQEAWVDKRDDHHEVVLEVTVLGQGWVVKVPIEDVELID